MEHPEYARTALANIDAQPRSLDMSVWGVLTECGTVACLAGHVLLAAGYELREAGGHGYVFRRPDGKVVYHPEEEAEAVLGTNEDDVYGEDHDEGCIWYDFRYGLDRFRALVEAS